MIRRVLPRMLTFASIAGLGWIAFVAWRIAKFGGEALQSEPEPASAIVVLGAGIEGDRPSPIFEARLRHGIELHRQGLAPWLILTGGFGSDKRAAEAEVGREYALAAGVPDSAILIETHSRTTLQNLKETDRLLDEHGLDRELIVVSDPYHLFRASRMAESLGLKTQASATPSTQFRSWQTKLPFLARETYFVHHHFFFRQ